MFHAKVESLSPGTGLTFSLLPAENATGNWVKVVQRLPVRLSLDRSDAECAAAAPGSARLSRSTPAIAGPGSIGSQGMFAWLTGPTTRARRSGDG